MPSIGWSEMLMLAVVAIVVVGPKELPRLMRVVGHWMGKAKAAAREFQQAFDDLARESEIEEMRRKMDNLRNPDMFSDIDETGPRTTDAPGTTGAKAPPETGTDGIARDKPDKPEKPDKRQEEDEPSGDREATGAQTENRAVPSH